MSDVLDLTRELIARPSVTPDDAGCQALIGERLQRAGFERIAGADEAGRGACAGPMVAAAVVLSDKPSRRIDGLDDSKVLTAAKRDRLYDEIMAKTQVTVEIEGGDKPALVADWLGLSRFA